MGVARAAGSAVSSPLRRAAQSMRQQYQAGQSGAAAGSAPSGGPSGTPAWATRMRREQQMKQGASAAAQSLKSGDRGGGGHSINLSDGDR
jgi:type IV secretion system protein TrbL